MLPGTISQHLQSCTTLEMIRLHSNNFEGLLPSLANYHSLRVLTISDNSFQGHLELPASIEHISPLLVFNNRLSCRILGAQSSTAVNSTQSLVLPGVFILSRLSLVITMLFDAGNAFSSNLPAWVPMRNVKFLTVQTIWHEWGRLTRTAVLQE